MAKDTFEEKLAAMIIKRSQESEKKFEQGMESIADIVGDSILNQYDIDEDFLDALESCKECAKTCDAADNLCRYVFYNENCKRLGENVSIKTMKCTWDYDYKTFCKKIKNIFLKEKLNIEKGFVYIFWTAAPLEYLYVGKANSEKNPPIDRFKCFTHTSVASSIGADLATRLTIIYPNNKNIENVEASVIRVFGIKKLGGKLKHNEKEGHFTEGSSELSQRLSKLKKFLGQLYDKCQ